ncbi:substrate-binding periplasmic protein [Chitinimonas naiadis]
MLLALLSLSAAADTLTLRTAAQEGSSPKFVVLADKQIGGICIELLQALSKVDAGLRFSGEQQLYPLPRIERMLETGDLDMACGLALNPSRANKFQVVQPPAYEASYGFAVRRGDTAKPANWDEVAQLTGDNTVLLVAGSGVIENLKRRSDIRLDTTAMAPQQNLAKLVNRRGRLFYYRLQGLKREIELAQLGEQLEVLPYVVDQYRFHLMLSRQQPPSAANRLRAGLLQLQASGELAQIIARWQP